MNVTIDVSSAINGKAGLGRFARTLARSIADQHPNQVHLFANRTSQSQIPPELAGLPIKMIRAGYKPWRMAVLLAQMAHLSMERYLPPGTDVYHATEHLLLPMGRAASILTVHDLIYRLFPEYHKKLNYHYLNLAMPLFVRRADHVITVSQSSKNDLIRLYGTPAEKISVIYEAAAPHFSPQPPATVDDIRRRYRLPDCYLVSVGTIEPRKNLTRLVEVLSILRRDDPALALVVVGSEGWLTQGFHAAIEQFGQQEAVILPGYVPDEDLSAVYAGALVNVVASVYEGFGLPVLEGMACGIPTVCSATSSVGEIAGDAALTF
nr:glycosyltransferase family 4 protein [Anaerolineae bacterium]